MSDFDPNSFLEANYTEANDTKLVPVPEGTYNAIPEKVGIRTGVIKKGDRAGEAFVTLDITWEIDDEALRQHLDRSKVTINQGVMLDIAADGKSLDFSKGKNITLGKVREALGLNTPGQPFSCQMIPGKPAKIQVKHRLDGEDIYSDVKAVLKYGS